MSVVVMSWVWKESRSVGADRLVLLAIADRASDEGVDAWPSVLTIAKKTRLSKSTILRSVARLEELGELVVKRADGRSNYYTLPMRPYEPSGSGPEQVQQEPPACEPDRCQDDTTRCQDDTGSRMTPVSSVTPPPVSLVTPNTSCTSSTHPPRARAATTARMPLVAKGESLSYDRQQRKLHASHHPEVCRWRDPTVRVCMPSSMPEQLAERLAGVPLERAVEDVIAWARADVPPVGYVGSSDAFVYWRDRWDQTRATASTGPPGRAGGRRAGVAPAPAGRAIPDAAETDALLEELGWVPS